VLKWRQRKHFAVKTFENNAATHGKRAVSRTVVFFGHTYFGEGNVSITDKEGRRRQKKVTTTLVSNELEKKRLLTVSALMATFNVSEGTMQTIFRS